MFLISGPGPPAVLANMVLHMVLHAKAHVDWIALAIGLLDEQGYRAIEASPGAVDD